VLSFRRIYVKSTVFRKRLRSWIECETTATQIRVRGERSVDEELTAKGDIEIVLNGTRAAQSSCPLRVWTLSSLYRQNGQLGARLGPCGSASWPSEHEPSVTYALPFYYIKNSVSGYPNVHESHYSNSTCASGLFFDYHTRSWIQKQVPR
jgi:hypothetical protein